MMMMLSVCIYTLFKAYQTKRLRNWWKKREVVKMFMTLGFALSHCVYSTALQREAHNQFTPFWIIVTRIKESLYNYRIIMWSGEWVRAKKTFGICATTIEVVKINREIINKFIVFRPTTQFSLRVLNSSTNVNFYAPWMFVALIYSGDISFGFEIKKIIIDIMKNLLKGGITLDDLVLVLEVLKNLLNSWYKISYWNVRHL